MIKATPEIIEGIFQNKSVGDQGIGFAERVPDTRRSLFSILWILGSFLGGSLAVGGLFFLWGKESLLVTLPSVLVFGIWRALKARRFSGLVLEKGGISYRSDDFVIFVPWGNLDPENPAAISSERMLFFTLLSTVPGKGYTVQKAHFDTGDITEEPPFDLDGQCLFVRKPLIVEIEVVRKIVTWKFEEFSKGTLNEMARGISDYPVILGESFLDRKIVRLKEDVKRAFPSFCPVSGEECDQMFPLGGQTTEPIMWMLSTSGERYQKLQEFVRLFSCFLALLLYLFWGYFIFFSEENIVEYEAVDVLYYAVAGMGVFLLPLVVWYLTREKIMAYDRDSSTGTVSIKVEDEDYFIAFVDLNVAPETPLPWREGPDE